MKVIFIFKYIWEIRTDNPSLVVKSRMVPLDQSIREGKRERTIERDRGIEKLTDRDREIK